MRTQRQDAGAGAFAGLDPQRRVLDNQALGRLHPQRLHGTQVDLGVGLKRTALVTADGVKIGIKSTAILFGQYDKLIIGILQIGVLALMAIIGELNGLGWGYYWSILVAGALFVYQQKLIANREREACFKAFMNNNYVGLVLFLGLAMSYWHF